MSQLLHTSDYMSISGSITPWKSPRLNLHFSIQVNWKMKSFTHFLQLIKDETRWQMYELKDYRVWYAIAETLWELGYPIGEYNKDAPLAMNCIGEWIDECTEELNEPETFYR